MLHPVCVRTIVIKATLRQERPQSRFREGAVYLEQIFQL